MSSGGDYWRDVKADRQAARMEAEPARMEYAQQQLTAAGADVLPGADGCSYYVKKAGKAWRIWPYKGYWSGPGGPGRGIAGLVRVVAAHRAQGKQEGRT